MEALTEEKAKIHIDGLPVEETEDEGCAKAALADVEEQMIPGTKVEVFNRKIFVGGLPSDLKIEEFSSFFERFGKITDAVIIPHAVTRRSRGFGFVTFDSKRSVDEVLQSSRYIIKDKDVEVKLAIPKQEINAAQQSIENRPIVNYYTWFPYEIGPNIYGSHHHFNAFTLMPGMQLHGNNRTESIGSHLENRDIDFQEISRKSRIRITSSPVVGDDQPSPSHSGTNNMHDRGESTVNRQSGGC